MNEKIVEARNNTHNAHIARMILDSLDKLYQNCDGAAPRRWIWELMQNAKDVVNSTEKLKIYVAFNEDKKTLVFKHNGIPFTTNNLVYLIEQASSKDRDEIERLQKRTTGKFGTGFLTTHLLSRKVKVCGILQDEGDNPKKFWIDIDRTGHTVRDIIEAVENSFQQLENNLSGYEEELSEDDFNTCFEYSLLDDEGIRVAKAGLDDLDRIYPYVFAFIPQIEEITVQYGEEKIYRRAYTHRMGIDFGRVEQIDYCCSNFTKPHYICVLEKEMVSISFEVEIREDKNYIVKFNECLPKIFCEFPLVGTEDFPFPVIVNSALFNPTEPRDGIFLKNIDKSNNNENRQLMEKALILYEEALKYVSHKHWGGIYNITHLGEWKPKEWVDQNWYDGNILNPCKRIIQTYPIVECENGKWESICENTIKKISFIKASTQGMIMDIWKLASKISKYCFPMHTYLNEWHSSLWKECHDFSLNSLLKEISDIGEIQNLQRKLISGQQAINWLNELYIIISKYQKTIDHIKEKQLNIFPDQKGIFRSLWELKYDIGIDNEYKEISEELGYDCRSSLLCKEITYHEWMNLQQYTLENLFDNIAPLFEKNKSVYNHLICLFSDYDQEKDRRTLLKYARQIFEGQYQNESYVSEIPEALMKKAIHYVSMRMAEEINHYGNINMIGVFVDVEEPNIWMAKLIELWAKMGEESLFSQKKFPILPNQNGYFKQMEELYLDDGELDETLKDLVNAAGYDIRNELLIKEVYLKFPLNREKGIKDVAEKITIYVKNNQGESKENKETMSNFQKLYLWMNENPIKAKKYFTLLEENKHWLYNDQQIAKNMEKAERLDSILKKYNVSVEELDEHLKAVNNIASSEKEISEEVLSSELLVEYGITTEEELQRAIDTNVFAENFIHKSAHNPESFSFVKNILQRSRNNVINYLSNNPDYDVSDIKFLDETIFVAKKYDKEVCIIARPSDYDFVVLYYDTEKDILDYQADWELWVENGKDDPVKLTFGNILKITGINRIPLKRIND